MKRILYAMDDDPSLVDTEAMQSEQHQQVETLSCTSEEAEERLRVDTQKRKNIVNVDVDLAASNTLSPRQRMSDASDVHSSGSLVTY